MTMSYAYTIAADGACSGNPGPGGWAFVLFGGPAVAGNELVQESAGMPETTNNQMELRACIESLDALVGRTPGAVALRLDSEYVLKGIFEWLEGWKARGWKSASKKPVANRDLWEVVDSLLAFLRSDGFSFHPDWVKGHAGDYANELVDTLAQQERDRAKFNRDEDPTPEMPPAGGIDLAALAGTASGEAGDITPDQVQLMRTILDLHASGDYSVKKVIEEIRANKVALGCA